MTLPALVLLEILFEPQCSAQAHLPLRAGRNLSIEENISKLVYEIPKGKKKDGKTNKR